jgi:hypothetical protein
MLLVVTRDRRIDSWVLKNFLKYIFRNVSWRQSCDRWLQRVA